MAREQNDRPTAEGGSRQNSPKGDFPDILTKTDYLVNKNRLPRRGRERGAEARTFDSNRAHAARDSIKIEDKRRAFR